MYFINLKKKVETEHTQTKLTKAGLSGIGCQLDSPHIVSKAKGKLLSATLLYKFRTYEKRWDFFRAYLDMH